MTKTREELFDSIQEAAAQVSSLKGIIQNEAVPPVPTIEIYNWLKDVDKVTALLQTVRQEVGIYLLEEVHRNDGT